MTPTQFQSIHQRLESNRISFSYFVLLGLLESSPKTMTEIAKDLSMSTSGATTMVDYMERKGLLERHRSGDPKEDRRTVRVRITEKGQRILAKINSATP